MKNSPTARDERTRIPVDMGSTQGETIARVMAAVTIGCVGLYFVRSMIGPAFFALTLVITVRPLIGWMASKRIPRPIGALTAILLVFAFIISLFVGLGVAVAQLIDTLPGYSGKFEALWDQGLRHLSTFGIDQTAVFEQMKSMVDTSKIVSLAQTFLSQVSSAGSILMIMGLAVVFLTFDMAKIEQRAHSLVTLKPGLATALTNFSESVRSYWVVSTVFGLIVAVLDVGALMVLSVPMAVTWGVVSFITNYIPNIGFVLGVIPPALLALVDSGPWTALWVIVSYSVLNFVIQSLIQPKFTGDAVGLNTTTTFLSLLFWTAVIGGLGSILAVPLTLFAKAVLIDSDRRSLWINVFLSDGDKPLTSPDLITVEDLDLQDLDRDGVGDEDEDGSQD